MHTEKCLGRYTVHGNNKNKWLVEFLSVFFLFWLNISISNKYVFLTESVMKDIHYPRVKTAVDFILPQ